VDSISCGPAFRWMWANIPVKWATVPVKWAGVPVRWAADLVMRGGHRLPRWLRHHGLARFPSSHCCSIRAIFDRSGSQ